MYARVQTNMPLDFKTKQCVCDSLMTGKFQQAFLSMSFKYESWPHPTHTEVHQHQDIPSILIDWHVWLKTVK